MDLYLAPINSYFWTSPVTGNNASANTRALQVNYSTSPNLAGQLDALNGLYARAYQMLGPADQLSGTAGRVNLSQSPADTSDRDVANVSYFDKTYLEPQAQAESYQFKVQQIALNQDNQGTSLSETAPAAVNSGTNTFQLTVGGTAYTLTAAINASDTNATALSKIAQAIDAANTGVTTGLVRENGLVHLNLYGRDGTANAFSLADVSGNAVSAAGLNNSTQTAQDAQFLLNGAPYVQSGNTVSLENGHLQVNLTGAGAATVTTGDQGAVDLVQSLTQAMSGFGSYVAENSYLTPAIAAAWSSLADHEVGILSQYGLEGGSQGQVGLDSAKFLEALRSNTAQTAQAIGGLASQVREFVKDMASYPAVSLLGASPSSGASYLRSLSSGVWYQPGLAFSASA